MDTIAHLHLRPVVVITKDQHTLSQTMGPVDTEMGLIDMQETVDIRGSGLIATTVHQREELVGKEIIPITLVTMAAPMALEKTMVDYHP